jgi:hypothetical protein
MPIVRSATLPNGEKLSWLDNPDAAERLAEERKAIERQAAMMERYQRMFETLERQRRWWQFWKA